MNYMFAMCAGKRTLMSMETIINPIGALLRARPGDDMKFDGMEIDDKVLKEYVDKVREMTKRSINMPIGVRVQFDDDEREKLHDEILDEFNQSRGSGFDNALKDYVEELGSKEGWFLKWSDLP